MDCCNRFSIIRSVVDVGYNRNTFPERLITLYTNTFYETLIIWNEIKNIIKQENSYIHPISYLSIDKLHGLDPSIDFYHLFPTYKKERLYFHIENTEYHPFSIIDNILKVSYEYKKFSTYIYIYYNNHIKLSKDLNRILSSNNFKLLSLNHKHFIELNQNNLQRYLKITG